MRNLTITMVVLLLVCAVSAQAQGIIISSDPICPQVGVGMVVKATAMSGTGALANARIWMNGDINAEGTTDGRGTLLAYVCPVPDKECLRFKVYTDSNTDGVEGLIKVAKGAWEIDHILAGSFEGAWSIAATDHTELDPGIFDVLGCTASCAGISESEELAPGESGKYHSTKGKISSKTIKSANLDLGLWAGTPPSSNGFSAAISGGITMTDIATFRFKPTTLQQNMPSKAWLDRTGSLTCSAGTGAYGEETRSFAAITVSSEYCGAYSLHSSRDSTEEGKENPAPISLSRPLPTVTIGGNNLSIPTARSASGQAGLSAMSSMIWGSWARGVSNATASDTLSVRPYSAKQPRIGS